MPESIVSKGSPHVFEALMVYVPEGLIVVSAPDLTVTAISELGSRQFGRPRAEIEGKPLQDLVSRYRFISPNGREVGLGDLPIVRSSRTGETIRGEQWIMEDEDGKRMTVAIEAGPVYSDDGRIVGAIASWGDISTLKALESDLQEALRDETALLGESHHRIRNHLQMLSTFLSVEAGREGATAPSLAAAMGNRLSAIASAQRAFQASEGHEKVEATKLLESVCQLFDSDMHPVKCRCDPDITLDNSMVTPLALAVNEAVTNALKHAFPNEHPGMVTVSLHRRDPWLELEIADDGVGKPDDGRKGGMGLNMLKVLAHQLRGDFVFERRPEGGSAARIIFAA